MNNLRISAGVWSLVAAALLALAGCGDDSTSMPPREDAGPMTDAAVEEDAGTDDAARPDSGPAEMCDEGSTLGDFCRTDAQCNDLCYCNGNERCEGGICVSGRSPCDDGIECTTDVCDEESLSCESTAEDSLCDDGNPCTGVEVCDPDVGCLVGVPMNCSDGNSCTIDTCDPEAGCMNTLRDLDMDGFADARCEGGTDCDDDPSSGASVNPDAPEICDNGIDDNCDGLADLFDSEACSPENDTCDSPRVLGGPGSHEFATIGLADDYTLECEDSGTHPDAVFQFTIGATRDVVISVPGSERDTAIELRPLGDCAGAGTSPIACDEDTSSYSDEAIVEVDGLDAGTYAIIVATPTEGFGSLQLEITSPTPPALSDLCDDRAPVISASGSYSGEFAAHRDDYPSLACRDSSSDAVDAAYRLSLADPSNVLITANGRSDTGYQRDIGLALVRDCATVDTTAIACDDADYSDAEIEYLPLPAGEYYILIEPDESSTVAYDLEVDIVVPPPRVDSDLCLSAVDVSDRTVMVDIGSLRNDGGLGCGGSSGAYRDAFFSFTLTETSDVVVSTDAPVFHLLSASTDCDDTSTELVCRTSDTAGSGTLTFTDLAAGTYYIGVAIPDDSGTLSVGTAITPAA